MQLADEGWSDAVRGDRRLRNRRERADASVREHGTGSAVQVNSTRHALGICYSDQPLILFRPVRTFAVLGTSSNLNQLAIFFVVTILLANLKIVTGLNQSDK